MNHNSMCRFYGKINGISQPLNSPITSEKPFTITFDAVWSNDPFMFPVSNIVGISGYSNRFEDYTYRVRLTPFGKHRVTVTELHRSLYKEELFELQNHQAWFNQPIPFLQ